jgi:hypothetical protein
MKNVHAFAVALVSVTAFSVSAVAQEKAPPAASKPAHSIVSPGDLQWIDAPPVIPAGSKFAVLYGDPLKAGPYTIRAKYPDGYRIPPHWHPTVENVTVLSGTVHLGMGEKFDQSATTAMGTGAFASLPAEMRHYIWVKGETVLQIHGIGPFQIFYVNPADDPTRAAR